MTEIITIYLLQIRYIFKVKEMTDADFPDIYFFLFVTAYLINILSKTQCHDIAY